MSEAAACEIAEVTDLAAWDDFVSGAVGGTIFSTSSWLSCAEAATGQRSRIFGCYKKGQLLAGVTGVEARRGGLKSLFTPDLSPHGGFLFRPVDSANPARAESEQGGSTRDLMSFLTAEYGDVRLTHAPALTDVREFSWAAWEIAPRYTYSIAVTTTEQLWERLERRTRAVIRKAEDGFRFSSTRDSGLLRRQYELLYEKRDGEPPISASVVQRFVEEAESRGLTESYLVEDHATGTPASIVVFVRGFDTIYAWVSGADPAFREAGATPLLYWKLLEQTTFPRFDFVGANIREIALFKRGFGGDLLPYYAVNWCSSPLLKTGRALRRIMRGS